MAALSLRLIDIPKEGMHMDCEVSPDYLDLSSDEGRVVGQLHWTGEVIKTDEGACVKGTLSGTVIRECIRCLQEFMDPISVCCTGIFHCSHEVRRRSSPSFQRNNEEESTQEFDDEAYSCEGNRLELADMLREHLIFATPVQPLCHLDCLGLCQNCGENLNRRRCGCREKIAVLH